MDVSDIPSSQETVEDPTLPGSSAEGATIIITPENAEARLAFNELAEWLQEQSEDPFMQATKQHTQKCMWVSSKQQNDHEIGRLLGAASEALSSSSPISSPRDPKSSFRSDKAEEKSQEQYRIWKGHYFMSLDQPPRNPSRGWIVGSLRDGPHLNDIVLCLRSDNYKMYKVRRNQAILQIDKTSFVYVQPITDRSITMANGDKISGKRVFNQSSAQLTFGSLCYRIQYARGSYADDYPSRVKRYLDENLKIPTTLLELSLTPTPSENSSITIGQWTVSAGTVGKGASGMVSIASNILGQRVALKRVQVGRDRERIQKVQTKLETLAALSQKKNENRLLRLIEVITDDVRSANRIADVWFVQEPAAQEILSTALTRGLFKQGQDRISIVTTVLVDILGATNFLHRNRWIHGDLKPVNIGIRTWSPECISLVLLDLDDAEESPFPGRHHPARPGTGGTIGWLAPEREMTGYNELADIWSIGVMAIEMISGRHPWRQGKNPWRPGSEASELQKEFHDMYGEAVDTLNKLHDEALREAVLGMVRHPYAETSAQRESRLTAKEALSLLGHVEDDENSSKRHKRF
ncbi:Serine/threonine-protein kinase PAK 3 [Fusarium oxysporum f. sp. rapae]|uniref:Serine/threonine-protein kinase PAK 3 n=1 Tax=Fusarium oxysporum f. sp. rapae TaxID=485398 RepID=A0A8J5NSR3_FUSOX|nr:Serine/threonine-protein kinase PAK 3 [Fusarium oxysporum f. sp. rapae]